MGADMSRAAEVRKGVRIEVFTVMWMVTEALVSIGAGILAGSALLIAFGLDSVIELVSGAMLLWRLVEEAREGDTERIERAEYLALWVVALLLALLCLYVFITSVYGLLTRSQPESSLLGILISIVAVVVMPWLGITKRRIAKGIDSGALRGDAASSFTCGYMAATV